MKNILVQGAGAIGCYFAATMALADYNVTLCVRDHQKAAYIREHGLALTDIRDGSTRRARVQVLECERIAEARPDLALLSVKAFDTAAAAAQLAQVPGNFPVVSLQNGFGNREALLAHFPAERIMLSIVYVGSRPAEEPGSMIWSGPGRVIFAPLTDDAMAVAEKVAATMSGAGLEAHPLKEAELSHILWEKLIVNSVVNTLASIYGVVNGKLPFIAEAAPKWNALIEEGVAVANAYGADLTCDYMQMRMREVCRHSAGNRCSMLEDVLHGRRTEIDQINGVICALGEQKGIPTPMQAEIRDIIKKLTE